ncbi:hypothetical protein NSA26_13025 [Enterococcus hirae]|uniref:hypothetical protein n=1 Tax=Enterococcus hirae TaxID=1354 RepID=UPI0006B166DE|nr:hypothetical protein [Enterococcus hirae]MCR1913494.1 hypothetical protein [Enterococcus hirae]QNG06924.1 hypothetical protein FQ488_14960 [Enterococcus hirae]QQU14889.1 hypothetical protein I6I82_14410 [Enterococcus hirae]TGY21889.1 hypothetical protein E5348_13285 [Enterococcus hirae]
MEIVQCEYYREQLSNHLYKAIGNQPLPDEYRDKESEEFYKDYYYFFVVDPKETDLKKLMFLDYVDTKKLDLVPATKKEVEFYKAVEHIFQYQEMQML